VAQDLGLAVGVDASRAMSSNVRPAMRALVVALMFTTLSACACVSAAGVAPSWRWCVDLRCRRSTVCHRTAASLSQHAHRHWRSANGHCCCIFKHHFFDAAGTDNPDAAVTSPSAAAS
jgi:hypothetical protein